MGRRKDDESVEDDCDSPVSSGRKSSSQQRSSSKSSGSKASGPTKKKNSSRKKNDEQEDDVRPPRSPRRRVSSSDSFMSSDTQERRRKKGTSSHSSSHSASCKPHSANAPRRTKSNDDSMARVKKATRARSKSSDDVFCDSPPKEIRSLEAEVMSLLTPNTKKKMAACFMKKESSGNTPSFGRLNISSPKARSKLSSDLSHSSASKTHGSPRVSSKRMDSSASSSGKSRRSRKDSRPKSSSKSVSSVKSSKSPGDLFSSSVLKEEPDPPESKKPQRKKKPKEKKGEGEGQRSSLSTQLDRPKKKSMHPDDRTVQSFMSHRRRGGKRPAGSSRKFINSKGDSIDDSQRWNPAFEQDLFSGSAKVSDLLGSSSKGKRGSKSLFSSASSQDTAPTAVSGTSYDDEEASDGSYDPFMASGAHDDDDFDTKGPNKWEKKDFGFSWEGNNDMAEFGHKSVEW